MIERSMSCSVSDETDSHLAQDQLQQTAASNSSQPYLATS